MPLIPALMRPRQVNLDFKATLVYTDFRAARPTQRYPDSKHQNNWGAARATQRNPVSNR